MEGVTTIAESRAEAASRRRRPALSAFLRTRRARVSPADVGMPPGLRRRTPGLRREEVAQLSGVGVTWYTWLEQGRPINASVQVLDAVARTLRLDQTEREHLYHLAEVPYVPERERTAEEIDPEVHRIIESMDPLPAVVYNGRYDVLAANSAYRHIFPVLDIVGGPERNVLWQLFVTMRPCCCAILNRKEELPLLVATLRGTYGRHVGEPAWEGFVDELCAASGEFSALWRSGDVSPTGARVKLVQHASVGELRLTSTSLEISGAPETRIVVYSPHDTETESRTARLREIEDPVIGCPVHARPLSYIRSTMLRTAHLHTGNGNGHRATTQIPPPEPTPGPGGE
ncbi:helix-turn-helix transcriptional regulator [Streptomyces iconiensis]|uniref:Helix-turn-helix transcriptional regulator n=1 Tax=Streptomyces iconiensis TaxID=1384038 RepID=A0ABT6ZMW4_9ACTN|nr:helix-turn-helix transcriptional regulator [Streptomyces iconiensis]MDJ1130398.1 helix-turn-helix transcriptional regulator [Streptomyces iconiensis]